MPINTGALGIRPVTPERPTRESEGIQRREDTTVAGFRPQTNVALRTAISDLAGTLERIATSEKLGMNKIPNELHQIIRNILEQSLSLEETIGKGIGSTIESQRFSMDMLSTFGRMLHQLGSLADKGFSMKLSPETQILLSQFKNIVVGTEGGKALEPVLLSKSAFELLDRKIPEQLPQAMYEVLSQLSQPLSMAQSSNQPNQETDIMNFLNKLVKFFIPRPAVDNQPAQTQQQPQNFQQPMQQNQPQNFQQPMNQNQPQNFQQPMQQNQPQNFQQPMQQNQPQNFQQPMNQNQPQNFQQPMQQNQPQNFQQPMQQNQPQQNFQQPMQQNQPQQNFQQPMQQNQPQNFQQPMQQNQPQNFQQPMQQNQPQNFQQPMNQNQPQNFQQPMQQNQPQNFQQPMQQNQPQNFQQPMQQNQPQNFQQPMNQNQPQNFQQPMNQNQPQNFQQPMQQNQPQNFQQPMQQNQPQQNFQQPMQQNQPQNFQQPMQQNQPQNFQQPMQQNQPQQNQQAQAQEQQPMSPEEFIAQQKQVRRQMYDARMQIMRQPMENSPRAMDTMKNIAQFLLKNTEEGQRNTTLLQNFINNNGPMLEKNEARHLQNLLRLCQQNIPVTVRQAAVQQNLPDLPRLWAFMQMCDMAKLSTQMTGRQFRRAGKDVMDFANSMRKAMSGDNFTSQVQNQRSFQMMVPIYLAPGESSYPTYLNVYDESNRDNETGVEKKETWVRICILTDHIGAAELTFRIYEGDQLDMRFYFSQGETAGVFATYVDDLRESLKDVNLQLGEIRIGSIGATMEEY